MEECIQKKIIFNTITGNINTESESVVFVLK